MTLLSTTHREPQPAAAASPRLPWKLATILSTAVLASGCNSPTSESERLAQEKGCMRCHAVHSKVVGPSFEQVADRYRGDASASERLAAKIRHGTVGQWGRVIMPKQSHVTPAEAKLLAEWVLRARQPRASPSG